MLDIFNEIFEAARRGARPRLRKRFYRYAAVGERTEQGYPVLLDGKPVYTPGRSALAAPRRALAERIAQEWDAQEGEIDPARMPLTRLANSVIDAVAEKPKAVAAEIEKYLGSDLIFYRADTPESLVARQTQHWDPMLAWARDTLGARFVLGAGVVHVKQSDDAVAAARTAIPSEPWRLGAVSSITALTGSALLALALAAGALDAEAAWAAAHVDEDWQMQQWGRDELALARRAFAYAEFLAAAEVLRPTR